MQRQTLATTEVMVTPGGSFFELAECVYPVDVRVFPVSGAPFDRRAMLRGYRLEGRAFSRIELRTATAQAIGVITGDQREVYGSSASLVEPVPALEYAAHSDTVLVAGQEAFITAVANGRRRGIVVKNLAASAGAARIGGTGVGAAAGLELSPGQMTPVLECQGQLSAYAVGNCTLSVIYLRNAAS